MTACDRIRADAPGLAALAAGDPERAAAWAHARTCAACARTLDDAERLQASIAGAAPRPRPFGGAASAAHAIEADLRREARARMLASALAAATTFAGCVALGRHRSGSSEDWISSTALAACAIAIGAGATRWGLAGASAAVGASVIAVVGAGGRGPVAPSLGVECLATELLCAAVVIVAVRFVLRRGTSSLAPRAAAAGAAAGALGGFAALQLVCPAHGAVAHLVAFHVTGVLLASAGAALIASVATSDRRAGCARREPGVP